MHVTWGNVSAEHDSAVVAWSALYEVVERQWTADDTIEFTFDKPSLEQARTSALEHLEDRIAGLRVVYIARIAGQEAAYQAKADQARAYLALSDPKEADPNDYPALFGQEAAARKVNAPDMASLIMTAAKRWYQASDRIDAVTFKARAAIAKAETVQDVLAILRDLPVEV